MTMTPEERVKICDDGVIAVRVGDQWPPIVQLEPGESGECRLADMIAAIAEAEADVRSKCVIQGSRWLLLFLEGIEYGCECNRKELCAELRYDINNSGNKPPAESDAEHPVDCDCDTCAEAQIAASVESANQHGDCGNMQFDGQSKGSG